MAWAKPAGAWAQAVEDEEAESGPIVAPPVHGHFPSLSTEKDSNDFPSLEVSSTMKKSKKEAKKKQTITLADLHKLETGPSRGGAFAPRGMMGRRVLTNEEILRSLPTTSGDRGEEDESSFERGFGDRGGRFERDRDRNREDALLPSRADTSDSWGTDRKFAANEARRGGGFGGGGFGGGGFGREERSGGGFGRDREERSGGGFGRDREDRPGGFDDERSFRDREDEPSKADEVDDWGSQRRFVPSPGQSRRGGGFEDRRGGGFDDREGGRRERDYASLEPSKADLEDSWQSKAPPPPRPEESGGGRGRGGFESDGRRGFGEGGWADRQGRSDGGWADRGARAEPRSGSRERLGDSSWRRAEPEPGAKEEGSGEATSPAPAERRRLVLAPRSAPAAEEAPRAASIFGAARPREQVLQEKGLPLEREEPSAEAERREEPLRREEQPRREEPVRREEQPRREEPVRREEQPRREEPVRREEQPRREEPVRREEQPRREEPLRREEQPRREELLGREEPPRRSEARSWTQAKKSRAEEGIEEKEAKAPLEKEAELGATEAELEALRLPRADAQGEWRQVAPGRQGADARREGRGAGRGTARGRGEGGRGGAGAGRGGDAAPRRRPEGRADEPRRASRPEVRAEDGETAAARW